MESVLFYITETLPLRAYQGFRIEIIRYVVGSIGIFFATWIVFAPLLKQRRIRAAMPSKLLNTQIRRELFNSMRTICIFVALDIIVFDLAQGGFFKTYLSISDYGWTWFIISIPFAIILHDTYFYWVHKIMHHKKLYKLFHLTHHRSHNPTPFTAYSFSVGEAIVMYAYIPLLAVTIPIHLYTIYAVLLIMIFKNAIAHGGYELYPLRMLKVPVLRLNTTVTHHDMHHEKINGNYGLYFTWWDKWMGTEHADYESRFEALAQRRMKPSMKSVNS